MADFTVNMSGTVEIDNSAVTEESKTEFILSYTQSNVVDEAVEYSREINAKSIGFPRFPALTGGTTPLNEREDIDSEAMSDTEVLLTPAEYGNAITTTELVNLQTGGRSAMAAMQLVGQNMGTSTNILGTRAMEASTNVLFPDAVVSEAALAATDVMSPELLGKVYNKMRRANVPFHTATGTYIAYMHDDAIHDLREGNSAGTWQDVNKYNNEVPVLRNEVGMFKGFRIVSNNDCLLGVDAAGGPGGSVDTYASTFLGYNGLGKAESQMPEIRVTGPFDKLGRFVNIGWYGVFQYKIIEPSAVWKTYTASSVGDNA